MTNDVPQTEGKRPPLLPDRYPTPDFFVCDIFDAAPKGDMAGMEHPVFSLSTKPYHRVRRYEHKGCYLEIKPSADGLATIHDRDILIYCISQLMAALKDGRDLSRTVRFQAYDLLVATNRMINGQAYSALRSSLERLRGTTISTNIITGGKEIFDVFGLIDQARIVRETREGRMKEVEVTLSDWVFQAIQHQEVLTLHRDYFRLRKPIERRIYELARKHCGYKDYWAITLPVLKKKCGSLSSDKEFKRLVLNIVHADQKHGHMPDYALDMEGNKLCFWNRQTMPALKDMNDKKGHTVSTFILNPDTYHDARIVAPGWDVYELEREWREWITEPPRNPDAAFIGFCRKWVGKRGKA